MNLPGVFLLLLLLRCSTSLRRIKPGKLLVATILDLENVESALVLLRSYRALGNTLNNATLLACVPVAAKGATIITDAVQHLQSLTLQLALELAFVNVERKSLVKFEALKHFYATRFDYLLWLDSNAVILRDPLPLLVAYEKGTPVPGVIQCAPELYSNPRRIDSGGTNCNTGVLLFDREAARRFIDAIPSVDALNLSSLSVTNPFTPSLYFSAVAARAGLTVASLPRSYSLNMMVSFETEILASSGLSYTTMPHIAHFSGGTSLRCTHHGPPPPPPPTAEAEAEAEAEAGGGGGGDGGGGCNCQFKSPRAPQNSLIKASLQSLLNRRGGAGLSGDAICRILAGAQDPPPSSSSSAASSFSPPSADHVDLEDGEQSQGLGAGLRCRLLQPPRNGSVVHVARALSPAEVPFDLCCHSPRPLSSWASSAAAVSASASASASPSPSALAGDAAGGAALELTARVLISLPSQSGPGLSATSLVPVRPAEQDLAWCFSWTTTVSRDASDVRLHGTYQLEASVSLALDLVEVGEGEGEGGGARRRRVQTLEGGSPVEVTVAVGEASYSSHPHYHPRPRLPPLARQRNLHELIGLSLSLGLDQSQRSNNDISSSSSKTVRGVIVCCETERGLQTTQNLLTHSQSSYWPWPGADTELVIILSAVPPTHTLSALGDYLGSLCSGARQRCVIIAQSTANGSSSALARAFPQGSLSFVYIDVFHGFADHLAALRCWWKALGSQGGGILAGSRYGAPGPASSEKGHHLGTAVSREGSRIDARHGVRLAVDAFMLERSMDSPSITYLDAVCDDTVDNNNISIDECLPGFYFATP